jgi:hypothetical protein
MFVRGFWKVEVPGKALTDRARALALHILAENKAGRSYRTQAHEDYGGQIHYATLNKFATHGGKYIPKDRKLLQTLGLVEKRQESEHEKRTRKKIAKLAKDTRKAVLK